jgi:ABC-type nitrate/sulfonate/bicarbonate transport system substrate-binding protein
MKKILAILLFFCIQNLIFSNEKIILQLKWKHQFQFAGYYIAKEKGFYSNANLDVEILESENGGVNYEEFLDGRKQFGVTDTNLILERLNQKKFVALAAIFQQSPQTITVLKKSNIKILSQFMGKKIVLGENQLPVPLQAMFHKEKIPLNTIEFIPNENGIKDILSNRASGISGYVSNEPFELEKNGQEIKVFEPKSNGVFFYSDILFTSEKELLDNPERVNSFYQASLKGWEYAIANKDEAIFITKNYNEQNSKTKLSEDYIRYEANKLIPLIHSEIVPLGNINQDRIDKIISAYIDLGLFRGSVNIDGFIFDSESKLRKKIEKYFKLGVTFFLPALILIFAWIFILRKTVNLKTKELLNQKNYLEKMNAILEKSEKKYKDIVENSKDIIFTMDSTYRILSTNSAMTERLIFTPEDLKNINFLDIVFASEKYVDAITYKYSIKEKIDNLFYSRETMSLSCKLRNKLNEPIEMNLRFQISFFDLNPIVLVTAIDSIEEESNKFFISEKGKFKIENYFNQSEVIVKRITNTISRFLVKDSLEILRLALREIIFNAIEHGNLEIDFDLKTKMQKDNDYMKFIHARRNEAEFKNRYVLIEYEIDSDLASFRITDDGKGFDVKKISARLENETSTEKLSHGRGIKLAKSIFTLLDYNEKGNSVYMELSYKKLKPNG